MSKQEFSQVFDYVKEAKVMLCSFNTIEDFQAIDPIVHLQLGETEVKQL